MHAYMLPAHVHPRQARLAVRACSLRTDWSQLPSVRLAGGIAVVTLPAVIAAYRLVGADEAATLAAALGTACAPSPFSSRLHRPPPSRTAAAATATATASPFAADDGDWRFWPASQGAVPGSLVGVQVGTRPVQRPVGAPLLPTVEAAAAMMAMMAHVEWQRDATAALPGRRAQDGAPRTTQPLEAITEETRGPKAAQYSAPKVAGAPDTTPSAAPARYDASFAAGPLDTTRAWQAALDTAAALAAALATDTMRSHRAEASKAVHAREGVVPSERPKLIEAEILARRAASATRVSATELITEQMTASRATARPDAPSTARPDAPGAVGIALGERAGSAAAARAAAAAAAAKHAIDGDLDDDDLDDDRDEDDEVVLETVHGEDVIDKKVMNAHGGAVASRAASAPTTAQWHGVLLLVAVPQEGGEAGGLFGSLGGGLQETLEPTDDL